MKHYKNTNITAIVSGLLVGAALAIIYRYGQYTVESKPCDSCAAEVNLITQQYYSQLEALFNRIDS